MARKRQHLSETLYSATKVSLTHPNPLQALAHKSSKRHAIIRGQIMNIRFSGLPKRFKAMSVLVLLHGFLVVIGNLSGLVQDFSTRAFAGTMLVMGLTTVISLLLGYLILTRKLWIIVGVSLLSACLLVLSAQLFMNHWPAPDPLIWLLNPSNLLSNVINLLEAIIALFGLAIFFTGLKTRLRTAHI
jgi:lysylphosphatidylglycerol synthetase-like protein (DUF2156 family)